MGWIATIQTLGLVTHAEAKSRSRVLAELRRLELRRTGAGQAPSRGRQGHAANGK